MTVDRANYTAQQLPVVGENVALGESQRRRAFELLSHGNNTLQLHSIGFAKLKSFPKGKKELSKLSDKEVFGKLYQLILSPNDQIREVAWGLIREISGVATPASDDKDIGISNSHGATNTKNTIDPESPLGEFLLNHPNYQYELFGDDLLNIRAKLQGRNFFEKAREWIRGLGNPDYRQKKAQILAELDRKILPNSNPSTLKAKDYTPGGSWFDGDL